MELLNRPSTMEEEAIKRNTDCVYFLASPLTCKKGSECEYRHSEAARINPRDCWYWMNGNCLNLKCAFRHPPLDGLLGTTGTATTAGTSVSQPVAPVQTPAFHAPAYNSNKQSVPCFYFQKGLCLKGDKCSFMHGSQPLAVPASQQTAKLAPANEAPQIPKKPSNEPTLKKSSTEPIKPTFQQKSPHKNIVKPVEEIAFTPAAKPVLKTVSPDIGIMAKRNTSPVDDGFIMKSKANNSTVFNGVAMINRPHVTVEDCFPAAEESDGFLGESSPGFDVLVDDELEDSDYFCNKDAEFGRAVDHRRSFINEFDYNQHSPVFLDSLAKYDREPHLDLGGHEFYGRVNDRFGWEQRRASSDRLERLSIPERRGLLREQSLNQISGSDLRHRLSKRRRVNNGPSRSDDHHGEFYQRDNDRLHEEQRYKGCSRRDMTHIPRESSISRRLQGRITLPNRSSPDRKFDSSSDRDNERGRNWGVRLSPGRSGPYLRHTDKIKRRVPEEILTMEERNFRGQQSTRRDDVNFAGPKSLSELKNANVSASFTSQVVHEEQKSLSLGKALGGHHEPESSVSFEGPKPLSVILKRKREDGFVSDTDTSNKEERKQVETENLVAEAAESQAVCNVQQSAESRKDADHSHSRNEYSKNNEILDRVVEDGLDSATSIKGDFVLSEEDSMMEEAMEDQEIEDSDQRDRESEEENGDTGDEFLDDEDGDDFARRLGVMFS